MIPTSSLFHGPKSPSHCRQNYSLLCRSTALALRPLQICITKCVVPPAHSEAPGTPTGGRCYRATGITSQRPERY